MLSLEGTKGPLEALRGDWDASFLTLHFWSFYYESQFYPLKLKPKFHKTEVVFPKCPLFLVWSIRKNACTGATMDDAGLTPD